MPTQTKKITLDTAALFLGKVIGLSLGMLRLNYVSTYLGLANFGILNFALYFCSLFQVLFDFGVSQLLTRDLSRYPSRSVELVGKALMLKIGMVFVAGLVVGIIALISHFESATNWAVLLTTGAFAINGLSLVLLAAFQAQRKMTLVSIYNILNDLLISISVILLIGRYPFIMTVLLLTVLVAGINLSMLWIIYVRSTGRPHLRVDSQTWAQLLRTSAPIAVSSVGISIYTFIGPTILKYYRGNVEVGVYTAGYKLISILTIIPLSFAQVVYPIFSDFYANAAAKLTKALQDSLRVMAQVSVPLAVGVVILAPNVTALLYPPSFAGSSRVLQTIICGDAFVYLGHIFYAFLLAIDRQRVCMWISIGVALVALLLNFTLVGTIGYIGAAYALVLVDLMLFASYAYVAARFGYFIGELRTYLKIILAAGVMGLVVGVTREWGLIPAILCGGAVYFGALFVSRGFGDQEREFVSKLLRSR